MTDTLPSITGNATVPIRILLINPNSTPSMTQSCLQTLALTLPTNVTVTGFTAPRTAPSAIEGHLDGVLSAADCIRALLPDMVQEYDAFLVACYSAHPLVNALREEVTAPVIGIMEASLYAARILGSRLGVVATGERSCYMHKDAIRNYGLEGFSVGAESSGLSVLELERKERQEVLGLVGAAAERLVDKGADTVCLGCAGMTDMKEKCINVVGGNSRATVIDGVGIGVQILVGLVREGLKNPKGGMYRSAETGRIARGQTWL